MVINSNTILGVIKEYYPEAAYLFEDDISRAFRLSTDTSGVGTYHPLYIRETITINDSTMRLTAFFESRYFSKDVEAIYMYLRSKIDITGMETFEKVIELLFRLDIIIWNGRSIEVEKVK